MPGEVVFGWCCCEASPPGCDCECEHCSDNNAPCCWYVTLTGMSNWSGCSTCNRFNATYRLEQDTPGGCTWSRTIPVACVGCSIGTKLVLTVFKDGSDYKIKVEIQNASTGAVIHLFSKTYGATPPNCCGLNDSLTRVSGAAQCTSASATCSISSQNDADCNEVFECGCLPCEDGIVPNLLQVTITGLANNESSGYCSGCANANGTWTLQYLGSTSSTTCLSNACVWRYRAGSPTLCNLGAARSCSGISIDFAVKQTGTTYEYCLSVTQSSCTETTASFGAKWYKSETREEDVDCINLDIDSWDLAEPLSNGCDPSAATASVTAL